MEKSITYVAMDTHKKQHRAALVYPKDGRMIKFSVKNTPAEIRKMALKREKYLPEKVCYK